MRLLFAFICLLSLLLCIASAALWVHGLGRVAWWEFRPSKPFVLMPPDPTQASAWVVRWVLGWGDDGELTITRSTSDVRFVRPFRGHYFSMQTHRNPTPGQLISVPMHIGAAMQPGAGGFKYYVPVLRTQREKRMGFAGFVYTSLQQEFVAGPDGRYVGIPGEQQWRTPLAHVFWMTLILPLLWSAGAWRKWRQHGRREGCCPACGTTSPETAAGSAPSVELRFLRGSGERHVPQGRGGAKQARPDRVETVRADAWQLSSVHPRL